MPARYALSYVPEQGTPLAELGRTWLGRDIYADLFLDQPEVPDITPERLETLTHWRRSEGMHGVLKPSFQLNPTSSLDALVDTVRLFCKYQEPVHIPQMEVNVIGKFLALTPTIPSRQLVALAAECVRVFEGFRQPILINIDDRYRADKLTVYQKRMLRHWGYPYVMEEFRFFIAMTDRIEDEAEREKITAAVTQISKPGIGETVHIRELTLLGQDSRQEPMRIIERIPFGMA